MCSKTSVLIQIGALLLSIPVSTVITAQEATPTNAHIFFLKDSKTNKPRMLHGKSAHIPIQKQPGETIADSVKRQFAPYFGINSPTHELIVKKDYSPTVNRQHIRYQQLHGGIPVIGGELIANLDNQALVSMSGETSTISVTNLVPTISATQARSTALEAISKWYNIEGTKLTTSEPQLNIYDPALLGPGTGPQRLVWQLNVVPTELATVNEYMLIDAEHNVIVLHFNQVDNALNRNTYSANNQFVRPGTLVCDESDPACTAGDTDAKNAHRYSADTYNFYLNNHSRDSLDNNGMTLISTVHYGDSTYLNASWDGSQMVYGDGFASADDVVAHELTHGVTQFTSNLLYYYQSGAINESLSDVWGEFVDLTNSSGTDSNSVRWLMGEDIPGIGAIRSMANPTQYSDPDRMTSLYYDFDVNFSDNGGVHHNSGINNKAVYLMVDGGNFNGHTISGVGITKVAKIYYEAQTQYLTSGSDYLDLYNALNQACQSLIGSDGITASDCSQVQNATDAVEMNLSPANGYNMDAQICPAGATPMELFVDNFEANLSAWSSANIIGTNSWQRATGYATSGDYSVVIPGTTTTHDTVLSMNNAVNLPATGTYYIHFQHAFEFETNGGNNYDGGVIEYTTDGGTTWLDAGMLIDEGRGYSGMLASGNPLAGQQAFTALSHGYTSTRLNLSSLVGSSLRFRFRSTANSSVASWFWIIDGFRIYTCSTNAAPSADAGPDQTVNANATVSLSAAASIDPDGDTLSYLWQQTAGPSVVLSNPTGETPSFSAPGMMTSLTFRLQTSDPFSQTDTDFVTITVNGPPTANAGVDQSVDINNVVTLTGDGNDPEGGALSYSWVQTGGNTTVNLSNVTVASPSFTAPASSDSLTFALTVTDNRSQTATDTVVITVQNPAPNPGGGGCSFNKTGQYDPIWLTMLCLLSLVHLLRAKSALKP